MSPKDPDKTNTEWKRVWVPKREVRKWGRAEASRPSFEENANTDQIHLLGF